MKKMILLCLLLLLSLPCGGHGEESGPQRLTLMIYMCGSNLESVYGSATDDIQEMLSSRLDPDSTQVFLMTGGSRAWANPLISAAGTSIYSLSPKAHGGGLRLTLRESMDAQSMGDSAALARFLDYCYRQGEGGRFALVLWDHGGGPVAGLCWDETFDMDHLTLEELVSALAASPFAEEKLCWIGFDACLMSSVELASALVPYAGYMIASQETEPAKGWDYAFLSDLHRDADGADTGRRIIDQYFDSLGSTGEILTMACVDLGKIQTVTEQMDAFFQPIGDQLNTDAFARLSGLRMASTSFGRALRGLSTDSYDLVDLSDLISHYGDGATPLSAALDEAVVYSRSSEEGANGLSVYHPYHNKLRYKEAWREIYHKLNFSPGYSRYMDRFGALLIGEALADWRGLAARDLGFDENGTHTFSLQLTPEQQAEFSTAQLLVLDGLGSFSEGAYTPVSTETAVMDENGLLTASYQGRTLYVVDEDGAILSGPVSFLFTDDGAYYVIEAEYKDYSGRLGGKDDTLVAYYCELDEETGDLRIVRYRVYDNVSGTFTNRIAFTEEGFTNLFFHSFLHTLPADRDPLPGFHEWESFPGYYARGIKLPSRWHLHMFSQKTPADLYAAFQVTDLQQNVYSTPPIRMENPKESAVSFVPSLLNLEEGALGLSAVLQQTEEQPCLALTFTLQNTTDKEMIFHVPYLVLNGNRTVDESILFTLAPGTEEKRQVLLQKEMLMNLERISAIELTVEVHEKTNYSDPYRYYPLRFETPDCDVSAFAPTAPAPIAEAEGDGCHWQLLRFAQNAEGDFTGLLHVQNGTDQAVTEEVRAFINGVRASKNYTNLTLHLAPFTDAYFLFTAENQKALSVYDLNVGNYNKLYLMNMDRAVERSGFTAVDRVDLYLGLLDWKAEPACQVSFPLSPPLPLAASGLEEPFLAPLLQGQVSASLEGVFLANDGAALALHLRNDSDGYVLLEMIRRQMNGLSVRFSAGDSITLPPHTSATQFLMCKKPDGLSGGSAVQQLSLSFKLGNAVTLPVSISFPEGARLGEEGGVYFPAGTLVVEPGVFPDEPMLLPQSAALTEPERAHPLTLTPPLTPEEAAKTDRISLGLCLVDWEKGEEGDGAGLEYLAAHIISWAAMQRQADGQFSGQLTGLALKAGEFVLAIDETPQGGGLWELRADPLYFYRNQEAYGGGLPSQDEAYAAFSEIQLTADLTPGSARLVDSQIRLYLSDYLDNRTNIYVNEAPLTVQERWIRRGGVQADGSAPQGQAKPLAMTLDGALPLQLVPADTLGGRLGVYYAILFQDGARGDRVVDWETGQILDPVRPATNQDPEKNI